MCEAGLHISLGIGLRLFNLLEKECQELDYKLILHNLGQGNPAIQEEIVGLTRQAHSKHIFSMIWYKFLESMTASHHFHFYEGLEEEVDAMGENITQHQAIHDWLLANQTSDSVEEAKQLQDHQEMIARSLMERSNKVHL